MNRRVPSLIASVMLALASAGTFQARGPARSRDSIHTLTSVGQLSTSLPKWESDSERDLHMWQSNAHLNNATIKDSALHAPAIDWDPLFLCRDVSIETRPHQHVIVKMRAGRAGIGELFGPGQHEAAGGDWERL